MNDLVKVETGIIHVEAGIIKSKVDAERANIISLALNQKLGAYDKKDARSKINSFVANIVLMCGEKMSGEDMFFHACAVYEHCLSNYPEITPEEIEYSFKEGVKLEYGKHYGLNARSFIFFIDSYLDSPERKEAAIEHKKSKEDNSEYGFPVITPLGWEMLIMSDFERYKKGDRDIIAAAFDVKRYIYLIKAGKIKSIVGQKWKDKFPIGVKEMEIQKSKTALKKGDLKSLREITKTINILEQEGISDRKMYLRIERYTRMARYFAFFDYCIKTQIDNIFKQE